MTAARGWPDDWDERKAGAECPLCTSLGDGENDHTVAVAELDWAEVRLERRSRLPGYCIAVWRHRHVAEPTELAADEADGYWRDVTALARAIEAEFRPVKVNLLTLGNWVPHLHTHFVTFWGVTLDGWDEALPSIAALARDLIASGELMHLAAEATPLAEVATALWDRLGACVPDVERIAEVQPT